MQFEVKFGFDLVRGDDYFVGFMINMKFTLEQYITHRLGILRVALILRTLPFGLVSEEADCADKRD